MDAGLRAAEEDAEVERRHPGNGALGCCERGEVERGCGAKLARLDRVENAGGGLAQARTAMEVG